LRQAKPFIDDAPLAQRARYREKKAYMAPTAYFVSKCSQTRLSSLTNVAIILTALYRRFNA
jgi:hypothetical protein